MQVLVYIGAVIVLFLFGIMLTRAPMQADETIDNNLRWRRLSCRSSSRASLARAAHRHVRRRQDPSRPRPVRTAEVSDSIFRSYLVPFEVVGVLLLAALIGAVVLARKD